jgi:glycosyltransferase involved in cell wall biosynthesis
MYLDDKAKVCRRSVSVVIPAYNSESILEELAQQMSKVIASESNSFEYEVVIINDRSSDNTWGKLQEVVGKYDWLRIVNLRKNSGQHNALFAGLRMTRSDIVILMDDDLQHKPKDIPILIEELLRSGADVCYAKFQEKKHAQWKVIGSKFNDWTAEKLIGKPKGIALSSFKAINRDVVDELVKYVGPYPYVDAILMSITDRVVNINISHNKRLYGKGNYNITSSLLLWSKMAMNYSIVSLRAATLLGILFSFLALTSAMILAVIKIYGIVDIEITGWTSTIIVILLVGGVQLLALGIIGEYLGRTYVHLNGKPQYLIKEIHGYKDAVKRDT